MKNNSNDELGESGSLLDKMLHTESRVRETSQVDIVYSTPLITKDGVPIIRRGTINVIQGKQGSHKSRLAELFASLLIGKADCNACRIGFERLTDEKVTVVYLDTERSIKEEFPAAIKAILINAGLEATAQVNHFRFTSLKNIDRGARLNALKLYIENIRQESQNPIFFVIDVITDGIKNFNDPEESMQLLDFLGRVCDESDSTALLVIHENPGGDKPRGHLGTEAINKAATVMQIGYEKTVGEQGVSYLGLKFLKQRHSERLKPIVLHFDKETQSLKLADQAAFEAAVLDREKKVTATQIIPLLSELGGKEFRQKDVLALIREKFGCSDNTAKSRLQEIADNRMQIFGERCEPCLLAIKANNGTPTMYELLNYMEAS